MHKTVANLPHLLVTCGREIITSIFPVLSNIVMYDVTFLEYYVVRDFLKHETSFLSVNLRPCEVSINEIKLYVSKVYKPPSLRFYCQLITVR